MISKFYGITKVILVCVLGLGASILAFGLIARGYLQHENAEKMAIRTSNGIQEGMYVPIGGIDQWLQIRGEDRDNPVLLFVHGGPGGSTMMLSSGWQPWEKYFTVVQWDERGAGRTLERTGTSIAPTMTIERMSQDGIEVVEYLRTHLHKNKVILVGHSFGSILSVNMVKKRPDLFFAYVGTGQLIGVPTWEKMGENYFAHVKDAAQVANNTDAINELASIQTLPDTERRAIVSKWGRRLGVPQPFEKEAMANMKFRIPPPLMPGFSLLDFYYSIKGYRFSRGVLAQPDGPLMRVDLRSLGYDFSIPIFLFEGTADALAPIEPDERYFEGIVAPHKEFVRFEGADHFLPLDRPDEFLAQLLARVRPMAASSN
jgi:pimeloyl-ACP methyl ester carboxylesterase